MTDINDLIAKVARLEGWTKIGERYVDTELDMLMVDDDGLTEDAANMLLNKISPPADWASSVLRAVIAHHAAKGAK